MYGRSGLAAPLDDPPELLEDDEPPLEDELLDELEEDDEELDDELDEPPLDDDDELDEEPPRGSPACNTHFEPIQPYQPPQVGTVENW